MKLGMVTVRDGAEVGNNDSEDDEAGNCEDSGTNW
jgi:hypothetical protein